jgi:hypothetical protein
MAKRVFYSFHCDADCWRVAQVRNIGIIDESPAASDHDWEEVKKGGDPAIARWIDGQMAGRCCAIVMIGAQTAGRKWINYEVLKAWNSGMGLVGVHIHNLKDRHPLQATKGRNLFADFNVNYGKCSMADVVRTYDPPFADSKYVYDYIRNNLSGWIDEAVRIRKACE